MSPQQRYLFKNQKFDTITPESQIILKKAHGERARPVCLCTSPHPEMYVAQIGSEYILKRMPGTGHLHSPDCDTFDPPPEVSGLGQLTGKAIVQGDDGETSLKLGFPISVRGGRSVGPAMSTDGPKSAAQPTTKLSLLALLHYLWDAAELTKWRPGMRDKRNWWIVRRELLQVAVHAKTNTLPLAKLLFIPEPFKSEDKDRLATSRKAFMHDLLPAKDKPQQLGIMIGELKSVTSAAYGRKLTIKHMPDFPFFMSEDLHRRFDKLLGEKMLDLETFPGSHLILIATFSAQEHRAEFREVAGMLVTAQWVPFDHGREYELLDALLTRSFIKCLKYNLGTSATVASALLLDTPAPVSLYCPRGDLSEAEMEDIEEVAEDGAYAHWLWRTDDVTMPDLPASKPLRGLV